MYDVEHFIAIINSPEAGILAVGSAMEVPVVENGGIKPGWPLCVKATISVDHRVSDGAEGDRIMQALPTLAPDASAGESIGTMWRSSWKTLSGCWCK